MKLGQLDLDKTLLKRNQQSSTTGFLFVCCCHVTNHISHHQTSLRWGGKPGLMSFGLPFEFVVSGNQLEWQWTQKADDDMEKSSANCAAKEWG